MDGSNQKNKIKIKASPGSNKPDYRWICITLIMTFSLSMIFTVLSTGVMERVGLLVAVLILAAIIFLGIVFDIIGMAVTTADEAPFNAMAIKKIRGSVQAIRLIKERSRVSNFCNDVIGDICGIISGSASAAVVAHIVSSGFSINNIIVSLFVTGFVAALTVGGKAFGKNIAIKFSNRIVYKVAVILYFLGIWRGSLKQKKRNS